MAAPGAPAIHHFLPRASPGFALLLGVWEGEGTASYPTKPGVEHKYTERCSFGHHGSKNYISYSQETWSKEDPSMPVHSEYGFVRLFSFGEGSPFIELVVANPLGNAEFNFGRVGPAAGGKTELVFPASNSRVEKTGPTAAPVVKVERTYVWDGEELTYEVKMQTSDTELSHHLTGRLRKKQAAKL
ncbi:hypothetical protein DFJ74DRAFT_660030 [Hyaloraphidium curvatum]|nr:hypothetical protein DFJ74DRAFT_660030 [Hyaloraphidium curvatum]